jgi:peptidoglycan/LPS O-acetylase OafA/YrhL
LGPDEQLLQANKAALAALWLSNVSFALARTDYFAPDAGNNLFLHTWSLGVEEQFYLIWPVLLLLSLSRGHRELPVARLKGVMLGILVLSLGASVLVTPRYPQFAFYMMPVRAWEFAAGALIWLYFGNGRVVEAVRAEGGGAGAMRWLGWIGMAMIAGAAVGYGTQMSYPGWHAALPVFGATAVIAAGWTDTSHGVSRVLSWRWLQAIGRISYSWYLWHWPVLVLGYAVSWNHGPWTRVVEVLVSLGLATVSYRFIESPVRHQGFWLSHRRAAIYGALGITVAICLLSMRWFGVAAQHSEDPAMQRYSRARFDAPAIYGQGCDDWYHSDRVLLCGYGPDDATHTLVLMGDSIAGQWSPAFSQVATRHGWRLIVITKSSCPMVDEPYFYARIGREYSECERWRHAALKQVASLHPDIVVLSMGLGGTQSFSQTQWIEGTARTLSALAGQVGKIYFLRTTPHIDFDGPDCLASIAGRPKWLGAAQGCETVVDDARDRQVYQWLQQATARFPNVQTLDMNEAICPGNRCGAERNGQIVFRDSQHMTASFAQSLASELERRIGLLQAAASNVPLDGSHP